SPQPAALGNFTSAHLGKFETALTGPGNTAGSVKQLPSACRPACGFRRLRSGGRQGGEVADQLPPENAKACCSNLFPIITRTRVSTLQDISGGCPWAVPEAASIAARLWAWSR